MESQPSSSTSNVAQMCPVCMGKIPTEHFGSHMSNHSKDEVVAALFRQTPTSSIPGIPTLIQPPTAAAAASTSTASTKTNLPYPPATAGLHFLASSAARDFSSTSSPLIMPQMMGMSMVMSPILVPQQNGPPIIINVPSYVYPNMLNSNSALSSTTPSSATATMTTSAATVAKIEEKSEDERIVDLSSSPRPGPSHEKKTSLKVEPQEEEVDEDEERSASSPLTTPSTPSTQKVCTVETVNDLTNAQMLLKSNEDIQIVVANDLLETNEFKAFMSHLNLPNQETSGKTPNHVPPNTPMTTRPPSTAPIVLSDKESDDSEDDNSEIEEEESFTNPQPSTSKIHKEYHRVPEDEDEDICLQDLVAMETMDQVHHDEDEDDENVVMETDDQVFTLASYKSSLPLEESFVNAILHDRTDTESFECDGCGLHFPTHEAYHMHRVDSCKHTKQSKNGGFKVKRSQPLSNFEGLAEVKSEASSNLSSSDLVNPSTSSALKSESEQQSALASVTGGSWKCSQCLVVFGSAMELFYHKEELKHAAHKCLTCHAIVEDKKMLLAHKKEFHAGGLTKIKLEEDNSLDSVFPNEKGEYVCAKCDRAFTDKELYGKHLTCHEEEKPFECLECGKKFAKAVLLRDHRKRHFDKGNFECNVCQKRFHTPIKLREHIRVHTGEAPLTCNICGKGFKRHSNLSEHKRIHDENRPVKPPKELYCHCGKMFKTNRELDWHKEEVHERVPKKCEFCGEVFVHSTSLTRHIRRRHQTDFMPDNKKASLSAKCPLCLQTFYKTSINKHIRIKHQGLKPFVCEICKMGFVTKNNLENHQWQHKGVRSRPFKCSLCRKAYLRQSQLDAHMRAHKGIKPFVCNECGLQFSNKSNWQRHVAEHSGARNHACPHCNKKFSRSYYLTDHMKVHTGVKPYSCAICGKTAATRSNYNSHLRTHITREPVNSEV